MSRVSAALLGVAAASDKHLIVGSPGVSFHRVANYVVVKGLEKLGYTVDIMDQMPHRDMYPKFVAGDIDLVTGTDLPFNHAPWLWNHTDQFHVIGTVNEATDIVLGVPSAAGPKSVSELVSAKGDFTNEVLSLDEDTCPACVKQGQDFADSLGFTMRQVTPTDFQSEVADRVGKGEKFIVSWYVPCYLQALVSGITNLAGDVEPWSRHNVGKVVIRRDRMSKLDDDARNFLGAAFVGNDAIQEMDVSVNRDGMSEEAAAQKWIEEHQEMWDSFFGKLHDPNSVQSAAPPSPPPADWKNRCDPICSNHNICRVGDDYEAVYHSNGVCYHGCSAFGWCGDEPANFEWNSICCGCAPAGTDFAAFSDNYSGECDAARAVSV